MCIFFYLLSPFLSHSATLHPQQGWKGSFCPLAWFPTSSPIIVTNNPWLRLVLTMTTTALILVMAVLNMVRRKSNMKLLPGAVKNLFFCLLVFRGGSRRTYSRGPDNVPTWGPDIISPYKSNERQPAGLPGGKHGRNQVLPARECRNEYFCAI